MKLFIEKLKRLTANNQHTEARILIASRYSYLKRHKEMYKAIQLISGYERKTSRNLLNIRDDFDKTMRNRIMHNHGRVIADMIEGAL